MVVGAGPNGLGAAAVLAREGRSVLVLEGEDTIGGGTRTVESTLPGFLHDHCSATHPLGATSPLFRELRLEEHGLEWVWGDVETAHPLDDGSAAVLYRSLDATAERMGVDARAWRRVGGTHRHVPPACSRMPGTGRHAPASAAEPPNPRLPTLD